MQGCTHPNLRGANSVPSYPYISGQGALTQTFAQLRKAVPPKVDAGYLQRFKIAPANESYIISILRFLGIVDEDCNRIDDKSAYLYGSEDAFRSGLENAVRTSYSQLFDEMADALQAERDDLVHWFRASDKTSAVVGQRQAATFLTLAALAGHGDLPTARSTTSKKTAPASGGAAKKTTAKRSASEQGVALPLPNGKGDDGNSGKAQDRQGVGLTVRIEVNLPPGGDADTYDAIFASIKKHLMS
jgi:uncharacterized protein DUF5343